MVYSLNGNAPQTRLPPSHHHHHCHQHLRSCTGIRQRLSGPALRTRPGRYSREITGIFSAAHTHLPTGSSFASLVSDERAPQNSHRRLPHSSPTLVFRKECPRTPQVVLNSAPHVAARSRNGLDVLAADGPVARGEPASLAQQDRLLGTMFWNLTLSCQLVQVLPAAVVQILPLRCEEARDAAPC